MAMAHNETLAALDALIAKVQARLALSPDYIELTALQKARAEIAPVASRASKAMVDDETGESILMLPTGRFDGKPPSQLEAALAELRDSGEPLTTPQLVERVRKRGGTVGGKNPNVNLGSTLSRAEMLKSIRWKGDHAWWFKNRPMPNETSLLAEAAE
jgi:hypothetical protein